MRSALLLVLVVVACKPKQEAAATSGCLDVPHAFRTALRADPQGGGLYWLERVIARDYDGVDASYDRLVRYDLATKRSAVLYEPINTPIQFTDVGVLAISKRGENAALVHIRNGFAQSLLPSYFDVKDVEPIEGTRYAILAGADGKWQVFTLDLDAPRPVHLYDANVLLSAVRGTVFVRDGAKTFAVDTETGVAEPREVTDGMPDRDLVYFVEDQQVKVRSLATNEVRTLVDDRRGWTLLHQNTSVLARAGMSNNQHAVLLDDGKATVLPRLRGGTALVGITQLAETTYALVGHNTSNVGEDLWTSMHEADVCILDTTKDVIEIESRTLPARYMHKGKAFWAAANAMPNTRWQIVDEVGAPTMMRLNIDENGSSDVAQLRDRVREIHKSITRMFEDDELRTYIEWQNGYTASYRWRRERLRGRATSGIGDLHVSDPQDFDLDLADGVVEKIEDGERISCRGKLTNLRTVTLVDLEIRCVASDRERVIRIAKLEPQRTHAFHETFDAGADDYLVIEVFRGRNQQVVRDATVEANLRRQYDFFVELQAATKLALRAHEFTDKRFYVQMQAPLHKTLADVDTEDVEAARTRIDAARTRLGVAPKLELELQLYLDDKLYNWDGTTLVPQ